MEPSRYQTWLAEIDALTEAQRAEVQSILAGRSAQAEVIAALEGQVFAERRCPHCQQAGAICRGRANGMRRFHCRGCGKTFNALTSTALAHLHHKGRWLDFAQSLSARETVQKSAARCAVAPSTAFRWRHRFLQAIKTDTAALGGIVEADETYVLESRKGSRLWQNNSLARATACWPGSRASVAAKPANGACRRSRCRFWWPPTAAAPQSVPSCPACRGKISAMCSGRSFKKTPCWSPTPPSPTAPVPGIRGSATSPSMSANMSARGAYPDRQQPTRTLQRSAASASRRRYHNTSLATSSGSTSPPFTRTLPHALA